MMFGRVNDNCEAIIKIAVGRIGSPINLKIPNGFHISIAGDKKLKRLK
jgi:hypothetical protein